MESADVVLAERRGQIAILTLNRPQTLNALTPHLVETLLTRLDAYSDDPDVRAVIITGAGRGFCSGFDLKAGDITDAKRKPVFRMMDFANHWAVRLRSFAKPTIAAVNGVAAGGGLALALACDLRIASENAKFSAIFANIGMPTQDAAGALLPQIVGVARALEMIYTAKMVEAAEAERIGLASEVVPADALIERAVALGERIASLPPVAIAMSKQIVLRGYGKSFDEQLAYQNLGAFLNAGYAPGDLAEAVAAFKEKRKPVFKGD
ncbi:MAG: enoyl-CoA hydratase/isomerase family protein [Caulobacteraceae bacterium]|nr:enoyl-CoA hydratase/isomerase family protein [Caulobacteraceae bacterium]